MNDYKNEDALVLFSGGQDSTTCLFWAKQTFRNVEALCFSYGQRHAVEIEIARSIAEIADVPFQLMDANIISNLAPNSLTNINYYGRRTACRIVSNTFVPDETCCSSLSREQLRTRKYPTFATGVSKPTTAATPIVAIRLYTVECDNEPAMDKHFVIHTVDARNKAKVCS